MGFLISTGDGGGGEVRSVEGSHGTSKSCFAFIPGELRFWIALFVAWRVVLCRCNHYSFLRTDVCIPSFEVDVLNGENYSKEYILLSRCG